jgi:hypothetical protein
MRPSRIAKMKMIMERGKRVQGRVHLDMGIPLEASFLETLLHLYSKHHITVRET